MYLYIQKVSFSTHALLPSPTFIHAQNKAKIESQQTDSTIKSIFNYVHRLRFLSKIEQNRPQYFHQEVLLTMIPKSYCQPEFGCLLA